jgi:peptide/nickel transport system substrate-binding protein
MENNTSGMRQLKLTGKFPKKDEINKIISVFSRKEKLVFAVLVLFFVGSALTLLQMLNRSMMVAVPLKGGTISEGVIGTPRFVNPILASSPADKDMVSLIYSGLMRKNGDGTLVPDLAEKYDMSSNGLVYTFTLREDLTFHDDAPVTADDIVFTIEKVKDSVIKSPYKASWDGVTVKKIDDRTVEFALRQPYPLFLENTTLGILPGHVWSDSAIELNDANTYPIGSGPYKVEGRSQASSGVINSFELQAFQDFALGEPHIQSLNLRFYPNEEALLSAFKKGEVDQASSITPKNASELSGGKQKVESSVLPRIFGLFFNQNKNPIFLDKTVTQAIDMAIDKDRIVREVLYGYGVAIDGPIPPLMASEETPGGKVPQNELVRQAEDMLAKAGWVKGSDGFLTKTANKSTQTISFSISTGNAPELAQAAEIIKENLEAVGMKVEVKTFEVGNLNQSVIRPREYEALLFGQIINHESDLFAFWHSSQRKDPGLNVAIYTNAKVDKILEDAFTTLNEEDRSEKYEEFKNEIRKDMPAVFLYSPNFIYAVSPGLKGLSIDQIISPADRFANIHSWYTKTENVWKIFSKQNS